MLPLQNDVEALLEKNNVLEAVRESQQVLSFQNGDKKLVVERQGDNIIVTMQPKCVLRFKRFWSNPAWLAENCMLNGKDYPMYLPFNDKTFFSAKHYNLFLAEAKALHESLKSKEWVTSAVLLNKMPPSSLDVKPENGVQLGFGF